MSQRSSHIVARLTLACLLCAGAGAAGAVAQTGPALAAPGPNVLVSLRAGAAASAAPRVTVLEARDDGLRLAIELDALRAQEVRIDGETFHGLTIDGGGSDGRQGEPMLPTFTRLLEIPYGTDARAELTALETTELTGYRPLPVQADDGASFVIDRAAYAAATYDDLEPMTLGDPAIARNRRVAVLGLRPVRYDGARQTLQVATRMEIDVRFEGVDPRNERPRASGLIPVSFDRLFRELIVNYAGPRAGERVGLGSYVIICQDNAAVIDALQPLIEWRTRKGYEVYLATTSETGSSRSEIQSWLRNAYATWETPPEYITLVGDAGGTVAIPCWSYGYGASDHPYVQLDGGDLLPDAHIGRISVESVAQLELYVHKIVSYESTPYMAETDWYTRACLVGDPSSSGYTCIQIMQWLKDRLLDVGYTDVDTTFAGPWVTQMVNKLNRGDTVFCYRGYWHMSGFTPSDILSLQNGRKMPFAVNSTCDTGSFDSGTAHSEAWIRAGLTGSPPIPTGGIASIGTATISTHTRYNNCLTYGVWRGLFWDGLYQFGAAFTRAKYELYLNYHEGDPGGAGNFIHWNNLMGDAAGEMWTGVPQPVEVGHVDALPLGLNAIGVIVNSGGVPVAGATVCAWKGEESWSVGVTDTDGAVSLPVTAATEGDLRLTVTCHDHEPYLTEVPVVTADRAVGYSRHQVDDDAGGSSAGNGDGHVNPGEAIELPVEVVNFGTLTAPDVTGTLSCADPLATITDASETFGTLVGGASAWSADDFDLTVDPYAPGGHALHLELELVSGAESWLSVIQLPVVAGRFEHGGTTLYGFGTHIDPGESGQVSVRLDNVGNATAADVVGTLSTDSPWITITDDSGGFGTIGVGASGENTADPFALGAAAGCFPGHIAVFTLSLEFSGGARQEVVFPLQVGTATTTDPTGPDGYGYYAFDQTDTGYPQAPIYAWVEIDPNHGGQGTDVGLSDFGEDQDDSRVVTLPFEFRFYGEAFTEATICSNGWITMGRTRLTNYRNWHIPGAGAPPYLITPMWDNLYQNGTNRVYHWFDEAGHRYIVQWSRLRNAQGNTTQNFELILYDPAHHATETGDGIIVFQYDLFDNSDYLQHYSTTGIQNADNTDGLLFQYFNLYTGGSTTIDSGCAIKFLPLSAQPRGNLTGVVRNASYGLAPVAGAHVKLLETGETMTSGPDGVYAGSIVVGEYTVAVSHVSFAPDTAHDVTILEGETTQVDFDLIDIAGPLFSETTDYGNTYDTQGPYAISTRVEEYSGVQELTLFYNAHGGGWVGVPLEDQGGGVYQAPIPGQPVGTLVSYYLRGEDSLGLIGADPPGAPAEVYAFWVVDALLVDEMEAGPGGWTHEVVTSGYEDQWHRSDYRNHTAGGAWSWKFGGAGSENYADMTDGALISEPFTLTEDAVLTFWHWMDAEISTVYPGYAYDGGLVELSIDGGPWTQITPMSGYPYRVREGSGPGPYPAETPIYSGTFGWTEATFELTGVTGQGRIRFRFGSDGADNEEGWYVDDVRILPLDPGFSGTRELQLAPETLALHPAAPNPLSPRHGVARIGFDLPQGGPVDLRIVDAGGRLVRTLVRAALPAGRHQVVWDGRNGAGQPAGSGVYFTLLEQDGVRRSQRLMVLR